MFSILAPTLDKDKKNNDGHGSLEDSVVTAVA